ncbi:unnamed protein product [Mucor hiemalis]
MIQNGQLSEYNCPICELDLAHVKSSYLRQQHVEKCLTSVKTTQTTSGEVEFDECVFCGKNLSHFKYDQKQVHLNSCLDESKEETMDNTVFAGQPVSFLSTLEICPVCHEVAPFLLQKFQWIGWGHLPLESHNNENNNIPSSPTSSKQITPTPTHRLKVTLFQDEYEELDNDFSNNVIIHKKSNIIQHTKRNREDDKVDEELQLALGLSKSMSTKEVVVKKKRLGVSPSNERDWNAANIWSAEESRRQVICKLDELLFPDNIELETFKQNEREKSVGYLNKSKITTMNYTTLFYWNLTSNSDHNWENQTVFRSLFLKSHHF